jgi:hypothetical protein
MFPAHDSVLQFPYFIKHCHELRYPYATQKLHLDSKRLLNLFFVFGVFLFEPLYSAGRVNQFLLSRKKRMALGTYFNVNVFNRAAGFKFVAAGATHCCLYGILDECRFSF